MKPVIFKRFNSIIEAELAKNLLAQYGVKSFVEKRGVEFPGDLGDNFGAYLFINENEVEKVKEILL